MELNRLRIALCLCIALLLISGVALAGTTTVTQVKYARELGVANQTYTLPSPTVVTHTMNVIRTVQDDWFVDVTINGGVIVSGPADGDMTFTLPGVNFIIPTGGFTANTNHVRFYGDLTIPMDNIGSMLLDMGGWVIKDTGNAVGNGTSVSVTITTADAATNNPFDQASTDQANLITGAYGVAVGTLTGTSAVIDVVEARKKFVATDEDTQTIDYGASLGIDNSVPGILRLDGTQYTLGANSSVTLVITSPDGDLAGIKSITFNGFHSGSMNTAHTQYTITIPGNDSCLNDLTAKDIDIEVFGNIVLNRRHLNIAVSVTYATAAAGGYPADAVASFTPNPRTLLTGQLSVWTMNGTVLLSTFQNGNYDFFKSRMYIYNPSAIDGLVTVDLYSLPAGFTAGFATSTLVGSVELGTLSAHSGVNIRLAEDVLAQLYTPLAPYVTNNGNLIAVVTINAANCVGSSQVYNNAGTLAFGTNPMVAIQ